MINHPVANVKYLEGMLCNKEYSLNDNGAKLYDKTCVPPMYNKEMNFLSYNKHLLNS